MIVEHGLFWTVFSAVLGALLMGGMFFGSLISYQRRERQGTELDAPLTLWIGMLFPIVTFGLTFYLAMGGS